MKDEDKALILINGVTENYTMRTTALQETDKVEDYEHVIQSLLNEEAKQATKNDNSDEQAFYST